MLLCAGARNETHAYKNGGKHCNSMASRLHPLSNAYCNLSYQNAQKTTSAETQR